MKPGTFNNSEDGLKLAGRRFKAVRRIWPSRRGADNSQVFHSVEIECGGGEVAASSETGNVTDYLILASL